MVSLQPLLETGLRQEKSNVFVLSEEEDSTTKKMSESSSGKQKIQIHLKLKSEKESSMPVSVPCIKLKISPDKLVSYNPNCQLIKDIGSGLNWKRKGLETILEQIHQGDIEEIVVAYKDRLCRFGYELFEWICQKHDTKIVVLNKVSETEDRTKELAEDLLSPSLLLKTTDSVHPKTDKFGIKVRKIKMLPNPEQKIKLIRWFGIYRFIYNKGLEILKNDSYIHGSSLIQQLRDRLIKNENYDSEKGNEWVKQLPADTRDNAIRELLHAFRNNLKSGHKFNMTFKTLTKY